MATLTRPRPEENSVSNPLLNSQIPSPFPREQLQDALEDTIQADEPSITVEQHIEEGPSETAALTEVMPSIIHVQRSCLMTLNNLLSEPGWSPILPDRRRSMPPSESGAGPSFKEDSPTSALQTLVNNLRNHAGDEEMLQVRESATSDAELLRELRIRVERISSTIPSSDALLATALVSLLSDLNRIAEIQAKVPGSSTPNSGLEVDTANIHETLPHVDVYDRLRRQLSDLQVERLSTQTPGSSSPLVVVETALLWSRIDAELENVVSLCKQRTEALPKFSSDHLPPQYDDSEDLEYPPEYDGTGRSSFDDSKSKFGHQSTALRQTDEKMRMDLEAVAMAIDRLYLVAPQLHNQRVELKSTKLAQMEKARREGSATSSTGPSTRMGTPNQRERSAKGKDKDIKELENLLDLIGKASERTLKDQSVVLDGNMQSRLERSKRRESAKRDAFVEQLVRHSEAGRMHGQDAVLQPHVRIKDPEALLTLPEFMREALPESELQKDTTLLTLPEFVSETNNLAHKLSHPDLRKQSTPPVVKQKKKRHRSLSAPPLAWLRSSLSSSSSSSSSSGTLSSNAAAKGKAKANQSHGFEVAYVAEYYENLNHILAFVTITGTKVGADIRAEVLPPFDLVSETGRTAGGDHLVIKFGPFSSLPLMLPAHTTPGIKEIKTQNSHYEVKLDARQLASSNPIAEQGEAAPLPALLDAEQLLSIRPTSFICASCSLPLVQSSKVSRYRDLPSEHWEELVDAWMCHGDQKLHDQVTKQGKAGFWPNVGEGLVGGSYVLFDDEDMFRSNLYLGRDRKDDNWQLTRCLCGAVIGRCQERSLDRGLTTVHKVLKYAVRPVSLNSDHAKVPLSAFIVEDMMEFVQAHASYRFVIQDEEEEKPRILIWLFKPRIQLSYTTSSSRNAIPKSGNIVAAKVLYKLLKPSDDVKDIRSILNKYPGFPQAEYLSYPMAVCRRVAGMLSESNMAYPESLRMMTGLHVGWLQRV
ncbi:hypothetical protein CPC08DRAFT_702699 [Agrocybe pediades]|nr:hypothetical protein CPC08DRAFT_702699 [Agrocybe pediades]